MREVYISVIVPTHNRVGRLQEVISALENQTYPHHQFEVIVISDGSVDGTNEFLNTLETSLNITPFVQQNQGVAAARNRGLRNAQGEIAFFLDDDVVPDRGLVAEHARLHRQHRDVVVLGPMLTPDDHNLSPWVYWEQMMLYKQYDAMVNGEYSPTWRQFYTGNSSLPRQAAIALGGFDESFRRAEDIELGYRLAQRGMKFLFSMKARGYHYAERNFDSWYRIPYAYGRNYALFASQKGLDEILVDALLDYDNRHPFSRITTQICLDRPNLSWLFSRSLRSTAAIGYRIGLKRMAILATSVLFNMRQYQGLADEFGGRAALLDAIDRARAGTFSHNPQQQILG